MASLTPLSLLPITMAVPVYVADEVVVGRCLFQDFMHREFVEEGVPEEILEEVPAEEVVPDGIAESSEHADENLSTALNHIGRDPILVAMEIGVRIREIAEAFAKSEERKKIRQEANQVDVDTISYEGFQSLMDQVFKFSMRKENIVALFYFCADVVIKCMKEKTAELGLRLFRWALHYIVEQVCAWVVRHGGWEKAMKNTFSSLQIAAMGAGATLACVAIGGFILYKWRT